MIEEPTDEPTDGQREQSTLTATYRGWEIRIRHEDPGHLCWVARGTHGPREGVVGIHAASAADCLDTARRNIDANYSMNADLVLEQMKVDTLALPAWVSDEEFLKQRGEA